MAVELTVRPASQDDAGWLAPRLRPRDLDEARAVGGSDVEASLYAAVSTSGALCWTAVAQDPVFVIGCAPVEGIPGLGSPWLVGTPEITRHPKAMTKLAKQHLAIMLRTYDALLNYVDVRNVDSVRWLELLGFTFWEPEVYGVEQRLFRPFSMGNI